MIMLCADVCWVQTLIEEGDSLLIHSLQPACLISGWDGDVRHTDAANDVEKKRHMFLFMGCSTNLHQEYVGEITFRMKKLNTDVKLKSRLSGFDQRGG